MGNSAAAAAAASKRKERIDAQSLLLCPGPGLKRMSDDLVTSLKISCVDQSTKKDKYFSSIKEEERSDDWEAQRVSVMEHLCASMSE